MPRFGVTTFPTDYGLSVVDLARAAEERGLDPIFFNEHTHIPVSRRTAFPGAAELPREYSHTHDPFVAFAAAAAATKRIRLSTGICLVIERDRIGSRSQRCFERVVDYYDRWMPIGRPGEQNEPLRAWGNCAHLLASRARG
jgi:hypothetical protein